LIAAARFSKSTVPLSIYEYPAAAEAIRAAVSIKRLSVWIFLPFDDAMPPLIPDLSGPAIQRA
jgi:hypothetical protein